MRDKARWVRDSEGVHDSFYLLVWPSFIYGIAWAIVMKKRFSNLKVGTRRVVDCRV